MFVCMSTAIGAAFDGVTADVWNQMEQKPINRSLLFGVGVIHGLLVARQMFGSRGLSQVYSFTAAHMQQSIEWVQRTTGQDVGGLIEPLTQVSGFSLWQMCQRWKTRYQTFSVCVCLCVWGLKMVVVTAIFELHLNKDCNNPLYIFILCHLLQS